jgi:hypothetical protein
MIPLPHGQHIPAGASLYGNGDVGPSRLATTRLRGIRIEVDADRQRRRGHHPANRRVPLVRQCSRPGGRIIAGEQNRCLGTPHCAGFDPDPWIGLQVADVVGLRP